MEAEARLLPLPIVHTKDDSYPYTYIPKKEENALKLKNKQRNV